MDQIRDFVEAGLAPIRTVYPHVASSLRRWIEISSISVYQPRQDDSAIREDQMLGPPNAYGVGKLMAEASLRAMAAVEGFELQVLRLPCVYGAWPRNTRDRRALPGLMRAAAKGEAWRRFGTGDARRDLIHVRDAADAIKLCLLQPGPGTWDVATGEGCSINEMIDIVREIAPHPLSIVDCPEAVQHDHYLDGSAFRAAFGFRPTVSLREGIQAEFRYHVENGSWNASRS